MNLYLVQYVSEKIVTDIVLKHPKLCFTPMKKCWSEGNEGISLSNPSDIQWIQGPVMLITYFNN